MVVVASLVVCFLVRVFCVGCCRCCVLLYHFVIDVDGKVASNGYSGREMMTPALKQPGGSGPKGPRQPGPG